MVDDDDVTTAFARVHIVVDIVADNRLFCSVTQTFVAVWIVFVARWLCVWHCDRNSDSWVCVCG